MLILSAFPRNLTNSIMLGISPVGGRVGGSSVAGRVGGPPVAGGVGGSSVVATAAESSLNAEHVIPNELHVHWIQRPGQYSTNP